MGMLRVDPRPVVICDPDKGAKQSFRDECDIRTIMDRYRMTGLVTHVARSKGMFADLVGVGDFHESRQRLRDAADFFAGLPSKIRREFDNDATVFLEFVTDPANAEAVAEMGLGPVVEPVSKDSALELEPDTSTPAEQPEEVEPSEG